MMEYLFEWDDEKDAVNRKRHASASSVRETGENGGSFMKKNDGLEAAPKGALTIIKDFLPPPARLVRREDTVRVTSEYTKSSIAFLKEEAKKANVPYQRMLRSLVDLYVEQQARH